MKRKAKTGAASGFLVEAVDESGVKTQETPTSVLMGKIYFIYHHTSLGDKGCIQ